MTVYEKRKGGEWERGREAPFLSPWWECFLVFPDDRLAIRASFVHHLSVNQRESTSLTLVPLEPMLHCVNRPLCVYFSSPLSKGSFIFLCGEKSLWIPVRMLNGVQACIFVCECFSIPSRTKDVCSCSEVWCKANQGGHFFVLFSLFSNWKKKW